MSSMISFFVEGEPKAQPRPRAFARKMGNKFVARVFDAGTAEQWKSLVALAAKPHRPAAPFDGPVCLRLFFQIQRPKSHYLAGKIERGLRDDAPLHHTARPDVDNLFKAVADALTQMGGFWHDDSQIAVTRIVKLYSNQAGCGITISQLEPYQIVVE